MWPGPYGEWGSRKYLLSSLDQSLKRMGLDYVDIFYSHRVDPKTPLEETMGALDTAVRQGKALYVGISSYSARRTAEAAKILRDLGTPLPHPPAELFDAQPLDRGGQAPRHAGEGGRRLHLLLAARPGMLTDKYLDGVPEDSRAASGSGAWRPGFLSEENLAAIARPAGHRQAPRPDPGADGDRLGAARPARHLGADRCEPRRADRSTRSARWRNTTFSPDELAEIDRHAKEGGVNLWRMSSAA